MAGLPAAFGLYSCAAAICGYTLVGSSKYLVGCSAASLASTAGPEQLVQPVAAGHPAAHAHLLPAAYHC